VIGRAALAATTAVLAVAAGLLAAGEAADARAPAFDGDAALRHVAALVAIGPRPAGSPAAARARAYISSQLAKAGVEVRLQPFEADTPHGRLPMANVIGVVRGRRPDVIMLGGHYDTKWFKEIPFVGANDGGSSAALLLELARRLAAAPREFTYWVAFFDGEEARESWTAQDSLYGSRRMAQELQRERRLPRALIVADMIGDRNLGIRRESLSTPWLTDAVWRSAQRLGHGRHFLGETQTVEDDHAPFLAAGVPAALLIDFDYQPWHTADDTLDKVSAQSLHIVGQVLLDVLPTVEARVGRRGTARP
jgi:Zn-dependent M28 family amino/carboxypeptidase